jgi:hypothetical protein
LADGIKATVDSTNVVNESDEGNNSLENLLFQNRRIKMKGISKICLALILVCFIIIPVIAQQERPLTTLPVTIKAPDLVVKEIKCGPGNKLQFTVSNIGTGPLPSGWKAVADVFFDGKKMGHIDLGRPTSGDIMPPGGTATYLVVFDIVKPVAVRVVVDATNSIKETNEGNNIMTAKVAPCEKVGLPDLKVVHTDHQPAGEVHPGQIIRFSVTIKNFGTGVANGTVKSDGSTTSNGYMIDLSFHKEPIGDPAKPHILPSPYIFTEGMLLKGGRISRTVDLAPGEAKEYSTSVEIPKDIKPGKYWIGVSLDPFNKVAEGPPTGEEDNVVNHGIIIK